MSISREDACILAVGISIYNEQCASNSDAEAQIADLQNKIQNAARDLKSAQAQASYTGRRGSCKSEPPYVKPPLTSTDIAVAVGFAFWPIIKEIGEYIIIDL